MSHPRSTKSMCSWTHLSTFTSPLSGRTVCVLLGVWYGERAHVHLTISRSFRLKPGFSHDLCWFVRVLAPLSGLAQGGYAGVRLGEARNPGLATHERDRTAEEWTARQRCINEAGDSVPGSQQSFSCVEFATCSSRKRRQRKPLRQSQHHHQ